MHSTSALEAMALSACSAHRGVHRTGMHRKRIVPEIRSGMRAGLLCQFLNVYLIFRP